MNLKNISKKLEVIQININKHLFPIVLPDFGLEIYRVYTVKSGNLSGPDSYHLLHQISILSSFRIEMLRAKKLNL